MRSIVWLFAILYCYKLDGLLQTTGYTLLIETALCIGEWSCQTLQGSFLLADCLYRWLLKTGFFLVPRNPKLIDFN